MKVTKIVRNILSNYESDSPAIKMNLSRILMSGKLAGTGKMVILPVDQGFEHGPARSFAKNPDAYDPYYHFQLAIDAGLNAYAAPIGMMEIGADKFAGSIPLILKLNSSNLLFDGGTAPHQATTASVTDAVRLGCQAIGFTIYPGSDAAFEMIEEFKELANEARSYGLASVLWSYPRGGDLEKTSETAIDVITYAAHIAALTGAHIIKIKPPTMAVNDIDEVQIFEENNIKLSNLSDRVKYIMKSCFNGKRLVVFSGGSSKKEGDLYNEIRSIYQGGGSGSIIGRNSFQRPRKEALKMLDNIINIYKGKF